MKFDKFEPSTVGIRWKILKLLKYRCGLSKAHSKESKKIDMKNKHKPEKNLIKFCFEYQHASRKIM